ncbi:MAG: hypothetical protein JSU90_10925 [Nitrospiraceae bacterium]|nr:MAG: hypothetical protein JSU90_10925 [Nitrospiraceae bacterium]
MSNERRQDHAFVLYMAVVLILAIVYFAVPERSDFIEFQRRWWGEIWPLLIPAS